MKPIASVLFMLLAVTACSQKDEASTPYPMMQAAPKNSSAAYLAYEHAIQIETDDDKVAAIFNTAQAACREATVDQCVVLESSIRSGTTSSASLKFRAKPAGIQIVIKSLAKQEKFTDQSTKAEDLESPIVDAATKTSMLKDYRAKLNALSSRATNDVDALIKVSKELADVQSQIEELEGQHAHLLQRVEKEILNVTIRSKERSSFWKPIRSSLSNFSARFSEAVAGVISAMAYLIPWLVILLLCFWGGRKLWRRRAK